MRRLWWLVVVASSACSLVTSLDGLSGDGGVIDAGLPDGGKGDGNVVCASPLSSCGGPCVDLSKDGLNCGKCGRSCFGATCASGTCPAVTVASGLSNPFAIRNVTTPDVLVVASADPLVDGGTSTGGVFRVPKPSGPPTRMWTDVINSVTVVPRSALAVNGTEAFFIGRRPTGYDLYGVRLNAPPETAPSSYGMSLDLTFHGADVLSEDAGIFYAAGKTYGTLARRDFGPATLITNTGGDELILPPTLPYVVMADDFADSVTRCDRAPVVCNPVTLYKGPLAQRADAFQAVGSTVYWTSHDNADVYSVVACKLPGPCPSPQVIATGEGIIGGLAVDASGAYWTDTVAGRIRACSTLDVGCGASATTLVAGETDAFGITTDATSVYWTIRAPVGSVRRVAK